MQTHRTQDGSRHVSLDRQAQAQETLTIELKARAFEDRLVLTHLMVDDRHGGCPRHAELMRVADRDVIQSEAGAAEVLRVGELRRRTPGQGYVNRARLCQESQAFGTAFLATI